ncbi:MAG: mitochondrial fission ELM1 family protein [Rhodospirillales bacterium]|nr:mitochondrial fission ELM1 family protein [Rhodospirillales bacterium]
MASPRDLTDLTTWVVTDGAAGTVNQCAGLASRLGVEPIVKTIRIRQPWQSLPPGLWLAPLRALTSDSDPLRQPWPALLIASGRKSVAPAAAIRQLSGERTICVQIQKPGIRTDRFDLVVAPAHDQLTGPNVIVTKGSVHGLTRDVLNREADRWRTDLQRPLVFATIGGPNKVYDFTRDDARDLGRRLCALPGSLLVTMSRRTTGAVAEALTAELDPARTRIWDGSGDNPYCGWLGLADAVVVTSDSVNMTTEACATGHPVHVAHLKGSSRKFEAFHALMERSGHTRRFGTGVDLDWIPEPLDDTGVVADRVRELLEAKLSCTGS